MSICHGSCSTINSGLTPVWETLILRHQASQQCENNHPGNSPEGSHRTSNLRSLNTPPTYMACTRVPRLSTLGSPWEPKSTLEQLGQKVGPRSRSEVQTLWWITPAVKKTRYPSNIKQSNSTVMSTLSSSKKPLIQGLSVSPADLSSGVASIWALFLASALSNLVLCSAKLCLAWFK